MTELRRENEQYKDKIQQYELERLSKVGKEASVAAARERTAKELAASVDRDSEKLQECEDEITRLKLENDRLEAEVAAAARKATLAEAQARVEVDANLAEAGAVLERREDATRGATEIRLSEAKPARLAKDLEEIKAQTAKVVEEAMRLDKETEESKAQSGSVVDEPTRLTRELEGRATETGNVCEDATMLVKELSEKKTRTGNVVEEPATLVKELEERETETETVVEDVTRLVKEPENSNTEMVKAVRRLRSRVTRSTRGSGGSSGDDSTHGGREEETVEVCSASPKAACAAAASISDLITDNLIDIEDAHAGARPSSRTPLVVSATSPPDASKPESSGQSRASSIVPDWVHEERAAAEPMMGTRRGGKKRTTMAVATAVAEPLIEVPFAEDKCLAAPSPKKPRVESSVESVAEPAAEVPAKKPPRLRRNRRPLANLQKVPRGGVGEMDEGGGERKETSKKETAKEKAKRLQREKVKKNKEAEGVSTRLRYY